MPSALRYVKSISSAGLTFRRITLKAKTQTNKLILFANGGSEPNISDNDKAAIEELCIFLRDNKDYKVVVIGHTDNYGDPERNLKYYGMKRAEVMRDYMVRQGAPVEQIKCESKGQNEPVADNATSKGRALNRRANIRFE